MKLSREQQKLNEKLVNEGYREIRWIDGLGFCGLYGFMYTVGLVIGMGEHGYKFRYCYSYDNALQAVVDLMTMSADEHPAGDWIKCKGYCIDYSKEDVPPMQSLLTM